jgi:addiction module RelE/StbE family toxin
MKIKFSKVFKKQYKASPSKIQAKFDKALGIFMNNKFDNSLNNHQLKGEFKNYRSINITGDWRAIYTTKENQIYFFVMLGTHSQLYK